MRTAFLAAVTVCLSHYRCAVAPVSAQPCASEIASALSLGDCGTGGHVQVMERGGETLAPLLIRSADHLEFQVPKAWVRKSLEFRVYNLRCQWCVGIYIFGQKGK